MITAANQPILVARISPRHVLVAVGLLLVAGTAWGGTVVSKGSGDWDTGGTWNGGVPKADDNVYIRAGDTVTITGVVAKTVHSLTITGTLTHANNPGTSGIEINKVNLRISNNLTIVAGGAINVDGKGFLNAGAGKPISGSSAGGSYGGRGARWDPLNVITPQDSALPFGSAVAPTNLGCGGTGGSGYGGGAVILSIGGSLTNNGTITANGKDNIGNGYGGGSGGSIYITCGTIAGSGTNRCNGGDDDHGAGGGGRMAVIVTNGDFLAFTGSMTAYGGLGGGSANGAAGTIYKQTSAQGARNGDLVVDNGGKTVVYREYAGLSGTFSVGNLIVNSPSYAAVMSGSTITVARVTSTNTTGSGGTLKMTGVGKLISSGGTLVVDTNVQFAVDGPTVLSGNLVLTNGAVLTHTANAGTEAYKLNLTINGDFTVAANATVNVNGKGYAVGQGPAIPKAAGGAGHGGQGGGDGGGNAGSLVTYGSITAPTNCGSGGHGGGGGGAIILSISGAAAINGTNSANGGTGSTSAGGSIYITCGSISGAGALQCNGGGIAGDWGGGGGGRISVIVTNSGADFSGFNGSMTALGGDGLAATDRGAAGTVYRKAANQTYGDLIVSNNLSGTAASTLIGPLVTDTVVGDVRLLDQAALAIDFDRTLKIYGSWSNAVPGLTVSGSGTVEFKGDATSTISGSTTFNNLKCVVPGKTLQFDGGSTQTVSGRLALAGADGKLLTLKSATPGTRWKLNAVLGSTYDLRCIQVADSEAVAIYPILAFDSDGASRNNDNWAFGAATNVWTGSQNAAWEGRQNWSLGRLPSYADEVVIAVGSNNPALDTDRNLRDLTVEKGAGLNLNNRTLSLCGDLRNAGKITGQGVLRLSGPTAQSVTAGGNAFNILEIANTGAVSFADSYSAAKFICRVAGAELVFNAGSVVTFGGLDLRGAPGKPIRIRSSASSQTAKWILTGLAVVSQVDISDNDAVGGNRICAVDSTGHGLTPNWDFSQKHCQGGEEYERFIGDLKYHIHIFTNSGTLKVNRNMEVEYLIVAGGGGGGQQLQGGGGGAGGLLEGNARLTNGTFQIVIGAGGKANANGGNSSIQGVGVALGGGYGARESQGPSMGGSGGGGAHGKMYEGAAGKDGQGYAGGKAGYVDGAGGGGAGGPGKATDDPTSPRAGGPGRVSAITGEDVTYAAGGAGRQRQAGSAPARNGGSNTGNGGEGCSGDSPAGEGGSGLVVVRYKLDIHNRPVSNVTTNSATCNALLVRTNQSSTKVSLLWGEGNGVASGAWEHTNSWKAGFWGANSRPSTTLILPANRSYYYTFEVDCAGIREQADAPVCFITGALDVRVTKRESTEEKPAEFVISRPTTATRGPLSVAFTLGGTGVNGTDYEQLDSPAIIPAGKAEIRLRVNPKFNFGDQRPKSVELTLAPGGYVLGTKRSATILTRAE